MDGDRLSAGCQQALQVCNELVSYRLLVVEGSGEAARTRSLYQQRCRWLMTGCGYSVPWMAVEESISWTLDRRCVVWRLGDVW